MDKNVESYVKFYQSQSGFGLSVFEGHAGRFQEGAGFGNILRSLATTILPILVRGAATFFGETVHGEDQGMSLTDAAKRAIIPAVLTAASTGVQKFQQKGRGCRRVYKGVKRTGKKNSGKNPKLNF